MNHPTILKSVAAIITIFAALTPAAALADDHGGVFASASTITATDSSTRDFAGSLEVTGDVDMFRFNVTETTLIWLYTTGSTDTFLALYDSNGVRLETNHNGGDGYNAAIFRTGASRLSPGTYFAAISAGGSSSQPQTGPYTLSIRTQSNPSTFDSPNLTAALTEKGEVDLFCFAITEETLIWLYTTGSTDTFLALYDSNGVRLETNHNGGDGYNAAIFRTGASRLTPGIYFAAISAGGSSSQPQTGPYTLSIRTQSNAAGFDTPNLVASLAVKGEVDFFRFNIARETMLWLYTTGSTDTFLALYDSNGVRLETNHNSGSGYNASIFRTGNYRLTAGTYFVAVMAGGSSSQPQTGPYTLSIRTQNNAMAFNTANLLRSLGVAGDVDLYRVDVRKPGFCRFFTTGRTDTDFYLYDANGTYLNRDNNGGAGYNAYLGLVLNPGSYYLRVMAGGSSSQPQTGIYKLSKRIPGNAEFISKSGRILRSITTRGDMNHYGFSTRGGIVDFRSLGTTDVAGYLYSSRGRLITSDQSSGNFRIRRRLPAGTYYLAVFGKPFDTEKGRYTLISQFPAANTTVPAVGSWTAGSLAHTFSIRVRSNTNWNANERIPWLRVSPARGKGNGLLKVTVFRNPGTDRTGSILVGGKRIFIRQSGKVLASASDWNGNGSPDLLVTHASTGETATWLVEGGKIVGSGIHPAAGPGDSWVLVNQGDFNGDGANDQVWQDRTTGDIRIQEFDGTTPGAVTLLDRRPGNAAWRVVAVGDFSQSGMPEIVLQNQSSGTLRFWKVDTSLKVVGFTAPSHQPSNSKWRIVAAGDTTGDGHPDLVFQHENGQLNLWIMKAHQVVASGAFTLQPGRGSWRACGTGDFNGDGKADLILQHATTRKVVVWHLDGRVVTGGEELGNQPADLAWEILANRTW